MGLLENFRKIVPDTPKDEKPNPYEVRLKDGEPLYHALIEGVGADNVVSPDASEAARLKLTELIELEPEAVLSCEGQVPWAARKILDGIMARQKSSPENA